VEPLSRWERVRVRVQRPCVTHSFMGRGRAGGCGRGMMKRKEDLFCFPKVGPAGSAATY